MEINYWVERFREAQEEVHALREEVKGLKDELELAAVPQRVVQSANQAMDIAMVQYWRGEYESMEKVATERGEEIQHYQQDAKEQWDARVALSLEVKRLRATLNQINDEEPGYAAQVEDLWDELREAQRQAKTFKAQAYKENERAAALQGNADRLAADKVNDTYLLAEADNEIRSLREALNEQVDKAQAVENGTVLEFDYCSTWIDYDRHDGYRVAVAGAIRGDFIHAQIGNGRRVKLYVEPQTSRGIEWTILSDH